VILDYPRGFPPDAIEQKLPTPAAARAALAGHDAAIEAMLAERRRDVAQLIASAEDDALMTRTEDATRLA